MEETIRFEPNGKKAEMLPDPNVTLLWVLRNKSGLNGTKYGFGQGFCEDRVRIIKAIQKAGKEMKGVK